jgi:hypothetical protein
MAITDNASFRAISVAVVPEAADLTDTEWREFNGAIERALSRRPAAMQRQLGLFLRILNLISFTRYGRSLASLSLPKRTAFLHSIENSKLLLFRRGFWGVRTLVFMGYYARPSMSAALGYAAGPRGWETRQ